MVRTAAKVQQRVQRIKKHLKDNPNLSLRAASKLEGIRQTTVSDRRHGRGGWVDITHPAAKLTRHQEKVLANHIRRSQAMLRPTLYSEIRGIANVLAGLNNVSVKPLGIHWVTKFIKRTPGLKTTREQY